MPKINGNEVRPGHVLSHKGGLWSVVRVQHVKPGKGGAFAQAELRSLSDGSKLNERFRSSENVERVRLEQQRHQFLYRDGEMLVFMDLASYEQLSLSADLLEGQAEFLQDGMEVEIESHEGKPLRVRLPEQIALTVVEAEPVVKGQTAAASYKPALMDNGMRIMVPPFIGVGERIIVDSQTREYVRRTEQK